MAELLRVGITGAGGMLGMALVHTLSSHFAVFAAGRAIAPYPGDATWDHFDLHDRNSLRAWLLNRRPHVVIHNAAIVNVDSCEKRFDEVSYIHSGVIPVIADTIAQWQGRLVYISTDAVFNGQKTGPYSELDEPCPLNAYGLTKLHGERATLETSGGLVLRTNIFGWSPNDRISFAEWLLKGLVEQSDLKLFTDVFYTPIHVCHLAQIVADLIRNHQTGLLHATGSTELSKHEFGMLMAATFGLETSRVRQTSVDAAGLAALRPKNMALSNGKLRGVLGRPIPGAPNGIAQFHSEYNNGWLSALKGRPIAPYYRFWERL